MISLDNHLINQRIDFYFEKAKQLLSKNVLLVAFVSLSCLAALYLTYHIWKIRQVREIQELAGCFGAESKKSFWKLQRKGANYFNAAPDPEWFLGAKQVGIEFARVAPDKWKCEQRDFLIGDADNFGAISSTDFEILKMALDQAYAQGIKVILTPRSLPGSRCKQNNYDQDDLRIWQQQEFRSKAIQFWKELANLLKDQSAVVGYNILNEPHPELLEGFNDYLKIDFKKWYQSIKGTLADLNLFYHDIVKAIREVDQETPIILDTGLFATPWAIQYLLPLKDDNILYSFHMYEPYSYTTRKINQGRFNYPGDIPPFLVDPTLQAWNKETLENFFNLICQWQKEHQIPSSKILVGEFGCDRTAVGAKNYFNDLINIFNGNQWHWAFYSFREDDWESMDYELGTEEIHWTYWKAVKKEENLNRFRKENPLFEVIKRDLDKSSNP